MADAAYFAGLDIGGTTVKAALLDATGGQVGDMVEVRSHGSEGYRATFKQLRAALDQLRDLGIAEQSLDRTLTANAGSAEHLEGHPSRIIGNLGGIQLGHRGLS